MTSTLAIPPDTPQKSPPVQAGQGDEGHLIVLPAPTRRSTKPLPRTGPFTVMLVGLYSVRYAAIGESHGLSVVAGVLAKAPLTLVNRVAVLDMAAHGDERPDRIIDAIQAVRPDVLGVAVPYGAFTVLERIWPEIRSNADECGARVIFGGALPTYLAAEILGLEPHAVVVNGEGERPVVELLAAWQRGASLDEVPGVTFIRDGQVVTTNRSLADLRHVEPPYRDHVPEIAANGGQVYAESSRACSWAACTFCLRGLTDIEGKPKEHRRFPPQRLAADFWRLSELGINGVVFADEDFLGQDLPAVESYLNALAPLLPPDGPAFEISTTIHSVYDHDDDRQANVARSRLLQRLRSMGLRKVFLGIESGSDSQLRRYAKGHTAEECAAAIYRVRSASLRLEVGFIMFDPLCTIEEIHQNVAFIRATGIVDSISAVDNELRLQKDARYLHILHRHEREMGRRLYDRRVDLDTLSHHYEVADPDVKRLLAGLRPHTAALGTIFYPAKNVSRHGEATPAAGEMRTVVAAFKAATLAAIDLGAMTVDTGHDPKPAVEAAMYEAGEILTAGVPSAHAQLPKRQRDHPVLLATVEQCKKYRQSPRSYVTG